MEELGTKSKTSASLSSDEERPLPSLQAIVNRFFQKKLNSSNLFEWLDIAERYRFSELYEFTSSLVCQHFVELSSSEQFLAIDYKRMRWIVCNDNIVASEASLLEALIRWYKHDEKSREGNFKALFSFIRLDYIRNDYLTSVLKKEHVYKILFEKQDRKKGGKESSLLRAVEKHAEMTAKCANVAVVCLEKVLRLVETTPNYDLVLSCWQPFMESKMTSFERNLKLSSFNGTYDRYRLVDYHTINIDKEIYVINTFVCRGVRCVECKQYCSYLFCYDITDGSFCVKAKLDYIGPKWFYGRNSVFIRVGFFLYYARLGLDGRIVVDRYNTRYSGDWESLTPSSCLSLDPSECCTVSDGVHSIYVVWYRQCVERYDIFSDTWEAIAPMQDVDLIDGSHIEAFIFDKHIIAYWPGRNGRYSKISYSIVEGKWQFIRKMSMLDVFNPYHCKPRQLSLGKYFFLSVIDADIYTRVAVKKFYEIKKKGSTLKQKLHCSLPVRDVARDLEYGPIALSRGAIETLRITEYVSKGAADAPRVMDPMHINPRTTQLFTER